MPTDLMSVLAVLDCHEPGSLLELRETRWLDARAAPYRLGEDPRAAEELAGDVAALANAGGGVIVIGIATRTDGDGEVLDRVVGVGPQAVDAGQVRELLRTRITPAPYGVRIGWSGAGDSDDGRVVFIHVPEPAPGTLFVVAGPTGQPGVRQADTVAVPVRDDDGTHWLTRTGIQALLSAGVRASGVSTGQALAALIDEAVYEAGPGGGELRAGQGGGQEVGQGASQGIGEEIGQGLWEYEREMREAHKELAGAGLGQPAGPVRAHGPAVLQDFHHARGDEPGWVLCLVADRPPVAVAAPVWQAVVDAGRLAPDQEPLAAVGCPLPSEGAAGPWVIGADARSVELGGGTWGAGRLTHVEPGAGGWRWEPLPRFGLQQSRSAGNWTAGRPPALRLRALVNLPWADAGTLEITKPRRVQLERQLPYGALAGAVTMLSRRRGAEPRTAVWERTPSGNAARSAGYTCTIPVPGGGPALRAAAMLALPTTVNPTVVACAEVLVEDPAAWARALGSGPNTRLDFDEVQTVLLDAWETAAELLPGLVGDPAGLRWAAPPTTELRITCERPGADGVLPALGTLVDLAPLGVGYDGGRSCMAVTVTAPPVMGRRERRSLMRQALVRMALEFGYVGADVGLG
ncbi:helix-turn-helix domain-containing protein [Streptomyces sp. NPDC127038]|uniref:AlbA family DNA-binding domain-containing protein n=1 Tax=Streptomyces sp. NPDC127038 TaxID=3347114 RepID=UPI00365A604F